MVLAAPPPSSAPAAAPATYGFRKAELGMDLVAWRASAPPRAAAQCKPVPSKPDVTECRVADQPLGQRYRAADVTHTFVGGRLASIAFTTSIDGFDAALAELKKAYGAPTEISRDTLHLADGIDLPHVAMVWRNGRSTIRLSDPVARGARMSVRFSLDGQDKASPAA